MESRSAPILSCKSYIDSALRTVYVLKIAGVFSKV